MSAPVPTDAPAAGTAKGGGIPDPALRYPMRPVGTWVVAGFLMICVLVIWILVAIVFAGRS